MGNTINSPEYKILKYLSNNILNENISKENILENTRVTSKDFLETTKILKENKFIHYPDFPIMQSMSYKILEDGLRRLEKMETDIEREEFQFAISKNTEASNRLSVINTKTNVIIAIFTFFSIIFTIWQLYLLKEQNEILKEELKLEQKKYKIEKRKSKKSSQPENRLKITLEIK